LRPASPYRRHSAIALVFAAWCAAYGLPAELVRDLTVQTVGFSQFGSVRSGKQAKVLLDRLSTRVRRSEHVCLSFFDPFLAPAATSPSITGDASVTAFAAPQPPYPLVRAALFPRPPPASFSA